MKRFTYERQIQVYMHAFMCVNPETMAEEEILSI